VTADPLLVRQMLSQLS